MVGFASFDLAGGTGVCDVVLGVFDLGTGAVVVDNFLESRGVFAAVVVFGVVAGVTGALGIVLAKWCVKGFMLSLLVRFLVGVLSMFVLLVLFILFVMVVVFV